MAGYSGTPLAKKLGIVEGTLVCAVGAPRNYLALLAPLPPGAIVTSRQSAKTDVVHLFGTRKAELATKLLSAAGTLRPDAAIWISWPKRASKVATDVTEDTVRELALPLGLVDVKVCAVDETWSGLKLVVRKENRAGWRRPGAALGSRTSGGRRPTTPKQDNGCSSRPTPF